MEKKDRAFLLFKSGFKQSEISNMLGVSEKTISLWSTKGSWQKKILAEKTSEQTRTERTMKILNFQLQCIEHEVDMKIDTQDFTPIEGKYADGILKLYNTIKSEAINYEVSIKVITKFIDFVSQKNINAAKIMTPLSRDFLSDLKEDL